MSNRSERRALALWCGLGGAVLLTVASALLRVWPFPPPRVSAEVAADAGIASTRLVLVLLAAAVIAAAAGYAAASAMGYAPRQRLRLATLFGGVAAASTGAYVALFLSAATVWGSGAPPDPLVRLIVIFGSAGIVLGAGVAAVLRVKSLARAAGMVSAFALGGVVSAYVLMPVSHLLGGAMVDLSEGLGVGGLPGAIIGSLLAGYVVGYVGGMTAGFSLPAVSGDGGRE